MINLTDELVAKIQNKRNLSTVFITGVMSSGKSTFIENIIKEQDNYYPIPEFIDPIPLKVLNTNDESSVEEKFNAQKWIIEEYMKKDKLIKKGSERFYLVDRTWIDALVYSQVYGDEIFKRILLLVSQYNWHEGTYINFTASLETLKSRTIAKYSLTETEYEKFWMRYVKQLKNINDFISKKYSIPQIDTTNQDFSEIKSQFKSITNTL